MLCGKDAGKEIKKMSRSPVTEGTGAAFQEGMDEQEQSCWEPDAKHQDRTTNRCEGVEGWNPCCTGKVLLKLQGMQPALPGLVKHSYPDRTSRGLTQQT